MAREPGSGDVRFPLRRPAESGDDSSAPQVRAWRPKGANPAPIEMTIEDSIANMRVIDAVLKSERSGGWEKV